MTMQCKQLLFASGFHPIGPKNPKPRASATQCSAVPNATATDQPTKCPVAKMSTFFQAQATSILGHAAGEASAHTWLSSGMSGQDVPHRLISGLRPLRDTDNEFLVVTEDTHAGELRLKEHAFDTRRGQV